MLFLVPYNVPTPSLLNLQSCSGISVDSHFLKCVLRSVAGVLVLSTPINDLRAGCMSDSEYSRFLASCKLRELAASNYFLLKLFFLHISEPCRLPSKAAIPWLCEKPFDFFFPISNSKFSLSFLISFPQVSFRYFLLEFHHTLF